MIGNLLSDNSSLIIIVSRSLGIFTCTHIDGKFESMNKLLNKLTIDSAGITIVIFYTLDML